MLQLIVWTAFHLYITWVVPWLRWFSPRRPGFDPEPVHVEFVLDKLAQRQAFLRILRVSHVNVISSVLCTWFRSPDQTGRGAHSTSWTMGTGSVFRGYSGWVIALTTHPHLVPRLRRADLCFSSPPPPGLSGPSWSVIAWTLPFYRFRRVHKVAKSDS